MSLLRNLLVVALSVIVLLALAVLAWTPVGPSLAGAEHTVTLEPPDSVRVETKLELPSSLGYSLFWRKGSPEELGQLKAELNGSWVPAVKLGRKVKLYTLGRSGTLTLSYRVNPTWYPPGAAEERIRARSRLDSNLGFLRLSTVLLDSLSDEQCEGAARLVFRLPPDWKVVAPWQNAQGYSSGGGTSGTEAFEVPCSALTGDYAAVGRFSLRQLEAGGRCVRVGVLSSLQDDSDALSTMVVDLVDYFSERLGFHASDGELPCLSVAVFPQEVLGGGAAGSSSILTVSRPQLLAHELFHLWNNVAAGGYEPGLAWAAEGFTEYMSARALLDLGVWSEAEFVGFMQRQERTYSEAQKTRGTSLEEASGLAWNNGNHWDQVYAGGALLAAELDIGWVSGHKREAGRLDPVFKELYGLQRRVTTEDLNTALVSVFGSEQAQRIWRWVSSKRPLTETIRDTNRRVE